MTDPLEDISAFGAAVQAAVFTLGIQPTKEALRAYWSGLPRAVQADAKVIAAKDKRKAELAA
jgi:hypothetical protein